MTKMKDSGIYWIKYIPESWSLSKNKYRIKINNGKEIENEDGDIPVYGTGGTFKTTDKFLYNGESVLLGRKGTIDKPLYLNEKFWTVDTAFYTTVKEKMNMKLFYYLACCFDYKYYQTGSTLPSMTQFDLGSIYIPDILREEQQLIVTFLDDKVENINEVLNDLNNQVGILNKYKKSLITETVTKGLNHNVEMKDSGIDWIGMIPKNWEYKKLKYILKNNCINLKVGPFGSALSGDDLKDEGYWVYNQRCVLDKNFKDTDAYVDEQKFNELKGFKVYSNDILITTRGTIGKVAVVPQNAQSGILHPCLIRFVVDNKLISNKLVELIFNESDIITEQIYRQSNATTIEVIYSYTLKDLLLPIIPMEEQKQIVRYLEKKCKEIDDLIKDKQTQIEKMEKYKKSLIYEYVTGKKRVKGAEELYG